VFVFPVLFMLSFKVSCLAFSVFFLLSNLATRDSLFLLPVSFIFFSPSGFDDVKYLFVIISPYFVFESLDTLSVYITDSAVECPVSQEIKVQKQFHYTELNVIPPYQSAVLHGRAWVRVLSRGTSTSPSNLPSFVVGGEEVLSPH
jgi:hypothetical protein